VARLDVMAPRPVIDLAAALPRLFFIRHGEVNGIKFRLTGFPAIPAGSLAPT
jgi:hypothetical protein